MSDDARYEGLKKLADAPVAQILAANGTQLDTPLDAPAEAKPPEALKELEAKGAILDMLRVFAFALPAREATWWACLAGRDILEDPEKPTPPLLAAEAWVFKPNDETRTAAREAWEAAHYLDDTVYCAVAATFCDGKLGAGELNEHDAPKGALGMSVFTMMLKSMYRDTDTADAQGAMLVDRAFDIARGGNGRVKRQPAPAEEGEA